MCKYILNASILFNYIILKQIKLKYQMPSRANSVMASLLILLEYAKSDHAFYCINKQKPDFKRFGDLDFYKTCGD